VCVSVGVIQRSTVDQFSGDPGSSYIYMYVYGYIYIYIYITEIEYLIFICYFLYLFNKSIDAD